MTGLEPEPIRVSGMFKDEALLGETDGELVCADGTLRYRGPDASVEIPHTTVTGVRVDQDKSVAGFRSIAGVFAVVTLLMAYVFVQYVIVHGGGLFSVIGLGSGLSAVLSALGTPWMYRLDDGERTVLQLDRKDGERVRFITAEDTDAFGEIERRIRETVQ
ncbi:hypothetical protein [Halarchaeum acidiphilum]|nr:hypothetical protein [Halarchaeum acidiphilum]